MGVFDSSRLSNGLNMATAYQDGGGGFWGQRGIAHAPFPKVDLWVRSELYLLPGYIDWWSRREALVVQLARYCTTKWCDLEQIPWGRSDY